MIFFNDQYLTIVITDHYISFILTRRERGGFSVQQWQRLNHPTPLLQNGHGDYAPLQALLSNLQSCIKYNTRYLPVTIILPDPVVIQTVFKFDHLPKNTKAINQMVEWRFDQEFQLSPKHYTHSFTKLHKGPEDTQSALFCLATKRALINSIIEPFKAQGIIPNIVDTAFSCCYRFFSKVFHSGGGIFIMRYTEFWTLALVDGQNSIIYSNSWYYSHSQPELQRKEVADKTHYIMKLYGLRQQKELMYLYLLGCDDEYASFKDSFPDLTCVNLNESFTNITSGSELSLVEKIAVLRL